MCRSLEFCLRACVCVIGVCVCAEDGDASPRPSGEQDAIDPDLDDMIEADTQDSKVCDSVRAQCQVYCSVCVHL